MDRKNQIMQMYLTSFVPFLENVPIDRLLALRRNETPAFEVFRKSLSTAVDEALRATGSFTEIQARQIYGDVIQPGLAKIDQKIRSSSRNLIKGTLGSVLAWGGAISFGLYEGLLPNQAAAAATALGLTKILADVAKPVVDKAMGVNSVENESLYFLWKVRREAERGGRHSGVEDGAFQGES